MVHLEGMALVGNTVNLFVVVEVLEGDVTFEVYVRMGCDEVR